VRPRWRMVDMTTTFLAWGARGFFFSQFCDVAEVVIIHMMI
jgi:hypothetical protein